MKLRWPKFEDKSGGVDIHFSYSLHWLNWGITLFDIYWAAYYKAFALALGPLSASVSYEKPDIE